MPNDSESTNNPFVRFKHHVDDQISQTIRTIWSFPSSLNNNNNKAQNDGGRALPDTTGNATTTTTALTKLENRGNSMGQEPPSPEFAALESAVSHSLRDETVQSWIRHSPYSPLKLQYMPQPVPKDLYGGGGVVVVDRDGRFTFRDALEDLLAVSSGQPLAADLASRPKLPTDLWLQPYGLFGSTRSWAEWEAGMDRRRLWDAYFPPESFRPDARRIATVATSDLFRRELTAEQAESYIRKCIGDAAACEEERRLRRNQPFSGTSSLGLLGLGGPSLFPFGHLDDYSHPLTRFLDEKMGGDWARDGLDTRRRAGRGDADTSEDLYLSFESDFTRRNPNVDLLPPPPPPRDKTTMSPRDDGRPQKGGEPGNKNKKNAEWTEEFPEPDGGKTVKSFARRVGPWMTHETVTTTRYDAQGNEVQRRVQHQHSGSKEWKWSSSSSGTYESDDENDTHDQSSGKDGREGRKSSWFWTK